MGRIDSVCDKAVLLCVAMFTIVVKMAIHMKLVNCMLNHDSLII